VVRHVMEPGRMWMNSSRIVLRNEVGFAADADFEYANITVALFPPENYPR